MKRFAVFGHPITHSLSPLIHQRWALQNGIDLVYEKHDVEPEVFSSRTHAFFQEGGCGLNITAPHKQAAYHLAVVHTERCRLAKSANVLWMHQGVIHADNTDGVGLIRDLPNWPSKNVLILGAGGAMRGILDPLRSWSTGTLTVANRRLDGCHALIQMYPDVSWCMFSHLHGAYDLVIHAARMDSVHDFLHLPSVLHKNSKGYDLGYDLLVPTSFLTWMSSHHCEAIDGLGMLVEQAAESFYIWHHVMPDVAAMKKWLPECCLHDLSARV